MRLLAARLVERGASDAVEVVTTFEPGGTDLGRRVRALLLDGDGPVDPAAEALLMAADRAQHVAEVIRPALERGVWVITDRFVPSSLAYQGIGRDLGVDRIEALSAWATGGLDPDLVVVLDVTDEVAAERVGAARDRMERAGAGFHTAVRAAYRDLAATRGWVVVDGRGDVTSVADAVWAAVVGRIGDPHTP